MSIRRAFDNSPNYENKVYGVMIGVVTDNADEESLGRVKVNYPSFNDDNESDWIRITTFMAGVSYGAFFLPEVGDEVLVAFENGDINRPYVIGSLWNGANTPPETNEDGENNLRVIKSRSGHTITFNDEDGAETLEITDSTSKYTIVFDSANESLSITADNDLTISATNGTLTIQGNAVAISSDSTVDISSSDDMTLTSSGNVDVSGSEINLN